ncbi:YopX protein [Streptococcus pneumoniae]|nr:YopX protein [Streptococcus pneumoniae]
MRPKFRAWLKGDKEMVDVRVIDWNNMIVDSFIPYIEIPLEKVILMQSTGLFDRNGKEVFVGDIVKCTRGCSHEVYLEKEYGGTFIGGMPAIYLKGLLSGYAWTEDEEIIGNIHENPELLENGK